MMPMDARRTLVAASCLTSALLGLFFVFVWSPLPWGWKGIDFYYEIALAGGRQSLLPTLDITDASHILFGTDFPAAPTPAIDENIDNFTELQTQRETALAGVDRENILELFPRFAAAPTLQEPRTGLTPSCAES